jgi:DNA replication protein DnaC
MTDKGLIECACRRERKLLQVIERSGIPPRYRRKTFEEYQTPGNRTAAAALLTCRRFVEEWPLNRHLGILLQGPVGVGKTHLGCVVLLECHRRYGASIAFIDLPELFTKIKATFDGGLLETEMEILKPLLAADILAIDELAAARNSDWNFSMTEQILNSRYNADKSTIITTNFPNRPPGWKPTKTAPARPLLVAGDVDFAARAAASSAMRTETLGDRIGARMFSRTQEMCLQIEIDGEDRRAEAGRKRRT